MQFVFSLLLISVELYAVLYPRRVDFFSIAAISSLIYLYPGLIGVIQLPDGIIRRINVSTYVCVSMWLVLLLLSMIINDHFTLRIGKYFVMKKATGGVYTDDNVNANIAVLLLNIVEVILCVYAIGKYGGIISSMRKVDLLAESDKMTSYLKYIALFLFVYSYVCKGKFIRILRIFGTAFIVYTFFLGHRSFAVMGLIGIFMYYVGTTEKTSMISIVKEHKFIFILMLVASIFFFFIKKTYVALFAGNFELVRARLTNIDYYKNAILTSEANTVMRNLQNIIESNMNYSLTNYFLSFITLIPFFGGRLAQFLGYEKFSVDVNLAFNTRYSDGFGIGCTYVGEAYALGGYLGIVIIVLATMLFVAYLNWKVQQTHDGIIYTFFTIVACYFTFFIFRNSQSFLLIMIRAQIYIVILLKIVEKAKLSRAYTGRD